MFAFLRMCALGDYHEVLRGHGHLAASPVVKFWVSCEKLQALRPWLFSEHLKLSGPHRSDLGVLAMLLTHFCRRIFLVQRRVAAWPCKHLCDSI